MIVKCKVCRRDIEINEVEYAPGDKMTVECERCGTEIEVTIPQREEKSVNKGSKIEKAPVAQEKQIKEISKETDGVKDLNNNQQNYSAKTTSESQKTLMGTENNNELPTQDNQQAIPPEIPASESTEKSKSGGRWIFVMALLLLVCGAGGWWYYDNIYLPEKIDREALRTYPIVNLNLRSSKMAGSDYNKVGSVPYGGELITYSYDGEWADVKYVRPDGSESTKGYAAGSYLVDKKDFYLLNSIFGDDDSREILATSKVRRALLDYYKAKGYVGKISPDLMNEVGLSANTDSQWQVFFPHGDKKPNEVVFKRLMNPDSKFTDMGLLIKNINTGDRKLIYFYFDDDETPHCLGEMDAPREGALKDVVNNNGDITPIFTD